ncbi:uncharacterized protein JCM6883_005076 [Sporobolomyces salmoneus]|uniref:uncharacterized protein n=1 Tax=Sporobolomyces salmoneus TaxID=183962 RepID=UPI00316B99EF
MQPSQHSLEGQARMDRRKQEEKEVAEYNKEREQVRKRFDDVSKSVFDAAKEQKLPDRVVLMLGAWKLKTIRVFGLSSYKEFDKILLQEWAVSQALNTIHHLASAMLFEWPFMHDNKLLRNYDPEVIKQQIHDNHAVYSTMSLASSPRVSNRYCPVARRFGGDW